MMSNATNLCFYVKIDVTLEHHLKFVLKNKGLLPKTRNSYSVVSNLRGIKIYP